MLSYLSTLLVYYYTKKYDFYKPNKLYIRLSQNIKAQFQSELDNEVELKEVMESSSKVVPFAYLVWAEVRGETLFPQIRESLIEFCVKAVNSRSLDSLQQAKEQERINLGFEVNCSKPPKPPEKSREEIALDVMFESL